MSAEPVAKIGSCLGFAQAYAKRGWPVIPLHSPVKGGCSCGNPDCRSVGKHPRTRNGLKDATVNIETIQGWWREWPDANVGLCTGSVSGVVAVDVDPRSGGIETWKWLCEEHDPPATIRAITGRGDDGFHLYFAFTEKLKGRSKALGDGIDVKAEGGYVVAPPSLHEMGGRYEFAPGQGPKQLGLAPLPEWCKPASAPKPPPPPPRQPRGQSSILDRASAYLSRMDPSIQGAGGSTALLKAAQAMVRGFDLPEQDAIDLLTRDFNPRCLPPWSAAEILHKVKSTSKGGAMPIGSLIGAQSSGPVTNESNVPEPPPPVSRVRTKLTIQVTTDKEFVVNQALDALTGHPNLYQRKGALVQIVYDSQTENGRRIGRLAGAPRIRTVPQPWLLEKMQSSASWVKAKRDKLVDADVPTWAAEFAIAREGWTQFDHLVGVSEVPILRADGTIVEAPGFDASTGMMYAPNADYPAVPQCPTRAQALASLGRILDLVVDFPFATPAHKSAWLAALLTPFTRSAFHGPAPFFLIDANNKGTGKGKLADIIAKIYSGRDFARCPQTDDPEEERKRITTMAIEGDNMVLFDDITRLGGKALDAALTATSWKERVLGSSVSSGELPLMINWYGTGNNVTIREDISRRVLHIRLDTHLERPEERTGFHHADLMGYVDAHRAELAADCLTILRAFVVDGRPAQQLAPWGSFERWSDLVRGCVVWLGLDDPGEVRQGLREASDSTTEAMGAFLRGWQMTAGMLEMSASDMAAKLRDADSRAYQDFRNAIEELRPKRGGAEPSAAELGAILRKVRGRTIGGRRIDSRHTEVGNVWVIS